MAKSKLVEVNKKIENGVVGTYKKIENGVVDGFNKISDKFVDNFLTKDGETVKKAGYGGKEKSPGRYDK